MTMQTVNSTLIQAIGYNALTEQLSVTMQKNAGTTYVFREAKSKGQYFNRNIRGRFPTTKVAN